MSLFKGQTESQMMEPKKRPIIKIFLLSIAIISMMCVGTWYIFRKDIDVIGISVSSTIPVFGQSLQAMITVENKGVLNTTYDSIIMLDSREVNIQEAKIGRNEKTVLTINISDLMPGKHTINTGGKSCTFTVYKPAKLSVTELSTDRDEINSGEAIKVIIKVMNSGDLSGDFKGGLTSNGNHLMYYSNSVPPNEFRVIEQKIFFSESGEYKLSVGNLSKTINVISPAEIILSDISLSEYSCNINEPVVLTAEYMNIGGQSGSYSDELFVNGESIKKINFDLEPGSIHQVEFDVTQSKTGKYAFTLGSDGKKIRTLNVYDIIRPNNGALLIKTANGGYGELILENYFTDRDILFILVDYNAVDKPLLSVYVHADSKTTHIKVKDGTYKIYYTSGTDYDNGSGRFISSPQYAMFKDPVIYTTTYSASSTSYKIWTIALNKADGNVSAPKIDEDEFPF